MPRRRLLSFVFAACIAAASALAVPASEPTFQDRLDRLVVRLDEQRQELHVPGLAIAVVKDDEVVLARGFGARDVEAGEPVDEHTLFAIGSTTKAFTAALIAMLVDDGLMSWDDPVTKYLPSFTLTVDTGDEIVTIRDLLCHRTGYTRMTLLWAANRLSRREILEAAAQAEAWDGFRENFHYNNVMYMAAGMAAAEAAGTDWDAMLVERILEPLGMTSTNTSVTLSQQDPRLAKGYIWNEREEAFERQPMRVLDSIAPAGAINSNVLDMARWVRLQLGRGEFEGRRLVSAEQLEQTWTRQIAMNEQIGYGLGWMLRERDGRRIVEHGGGIDGFTAEVGLFPDDNLGFVALVNSVGTPMAGLTTSIVHDVLLGDWETGEQGGMTLADLDPYVGTYIANFAHFKDAEFKVLVKSGALAIDIPGQMVFEMKPPDENGRWEFALPVGIAIGFNRDGDDDGKVTSLVVYQAGYEFEALRKGVEPPIEIPLADLQPYLGTYRFDDKEVDVKALIRNNRLAVDVPGQMVYELYPPDEEGWRALRVKPELKVAFNETADGSIESLTLLQAGAPSVLPRIADRPESVLPSPAEVESLVRAGYGAAAIDAIDGLRIAGAADYVHQGAKGEFEILAAGTDRYRLHTSFGRMGEVDVAVDGDRGWAASSFQPFKELKDERLEHVKLDHPLAMFRDWSTTFDSVAVLRDDEIDGQRVYVVKLGRGEVPARTIYVSVDTGRILKQESVEIAEEMGVTVPVTVTYDDFRSIEGGLTLPFRSAIENPATGRLVVQTEVVQVNPVFPDGAFRLTEGD